MATSIRCKADPSYGVTVFRCLRVGNKAARQCTCHGLHTSPELEVAMTSPCVCMANNGQDASLPPIDNNHSCSRTPTCHKHCMHTDEGLVNFRDVEDLVMLMRIFFALALVFRCSGEAMLK